MFCARCGNQVPGGDRVCTQCGANLLELFAVRSTPPEAPDAIPATTGDPADTQPGVRPDAPGAMEPDPAGDAPTIASPRLSDSQVWDRFMRPAAGRDAASTGTDADTGTQPLPRLDDITRPLPDMSPRDGAPGELAPLERTRVMGPLETPDTVAGPGFSGAPADAALPDHAGTVSSDGDASVDDLPPEWFRGATAIDPATGTARPRPGAPGSAQRASAPLGSMIEPAPGRPPAPGQRRRHDRLSVAGVAALVCVPVALVAVFVGRYLSQHHGTHDTHTVATAVHTPAAASGTTAPAGSSPAASTSATGQATASAGTSAPAGVPVNATACSASVWAGAGTSCEFAQVVAAAASANTAEDFQVSATSPVTGTRYTMNCSRTAGLDTCTGGRAAAVYVRVG